MRIKMIYTLSLVSFFLISGNVWAEKTDIKSKKKVSKNIFKIKPMPAMAKPAPKATAPIIVETKVAPVSEGRVYGMLDMRPGISLGKGSFSSENFAELGYKFNKNISLGYQQQFTHSMDGNNFSPGLGDGLLRFAANNVLTDGNGLKFHYEARVYAPTNMMVYDRGQLFSVRNYFVIEKAFSDSFSLLLVELPIFHAYSQDTAEMPTGTSANPIFENRVYLGPLWSGKNGSFSLFLPMKWIASKTRAVSIANVTNSDRWGSGLIFNPELLVLVAKGVNIGLEFETSSFFDTNMNFDIAKGFSNGVAKFVFQINF